MLKTLIDAINAQLDLLAITDSFNDIHLALTETPFLHIDDILAETIDFAPEYATLATDNLSLDDDDFDHYCFIRLQNAYASTAYFLDTMPDSPIHSILRLTA